MFSISSDSQSIAPEAALSKDEAARSYRTPLCAPITDPRAMRLLVAIGLLTLSAVVLAASVSSSSSASGWLANPAIPVLAAVAVGLAAVDQVIRRELKLTLVNAR